MSTLVVINPNCRNGDAEIGDILDALLPMGQLATHTLGQDGSLEDQINDMGEDLDRIVVGGGDGTLNNVLPLALKAGVPIGVLPLGTANDFARSLNLPSNPVAAAKIISDGHTRQVDVGVVNDHYFLNAVGIGLGPELTRQMDREQKKRLGVVAYLENLIKVIGNRSQRYARIVAGDKRLREAFVQITIANGRHYGGGLMVSDDVKMDDGLLHVLCVRPVTPMELFMRGLRLRFGAVENDEKLVYVKGKKVSVSTSREAEVTADGELITETPIRCECLQKALTVYVEAEEAQTEPEATEEPVYDQAV